MGDAGGAHGEREASLRLAGFLEDAGFQAEEFDLGVDVEVLGLHGVGGLVDHSEGAAVVALSDCVFDCVEGEEEAHVEVEELDGLELGEDVLDGYLVVAAFC